MDIYNYNKSVGNVDHNNSELLFGEEIIKVCNYYCGD